MFEELFVSMDVFRDIYISLKNIYDKNENIGIIVWSSYL